MIGYTGQVGVSQTCQHAGFALEHAFIILGGISIFLECDQMVLVDVVIDCEIDGTHAAFAELS